MLELRHASRASKGARNYQEDAAAVWPGNGVLVPRAAPTASTSLVAVLADGMGGHAAGDVASNTICGIFLQYLAGAGDGPVPGLLSRALAAANAAIRAKVAANPGMEGMGATLVGVLFGVAGAEWISVGDSPLYLWRDGDIALVNEDHSLTPILEQMVADGRMTADEAATDGRRHMLRSAVTGEGIDMIDASQRPLVLEPGDCIVLASDGLDTLADADIADLVGRHRDDGAAAIANALLHAVESVGNPYQDNTTVVVICVPAG